MTKPNVRVLGAALTWLLIATNAFASVPELDPGSAATALALLAGGLLVLNGRRKR